MAMPLNPERFHWTDYVSDAKQSFYTADLLLDPGGAILPHCHDYYEFFIVLQGEFSEICREGSTKLSRRQGHILRPADSHLLRNDSRKPAVLRNIAVCRDSFEGLLSHGGFPEPLGPYPYFSLEENAFSQYCFETERARQPQMLADTRQFLLGHVCGTVLISACIPDNPFDAPQWLRTLHEEMKKEENFTLGIRQMRNLSGRSQEYLNRAFRKYYGQTPSAYVNGLRLSHAAFLLQTTKTSVLDISAACGFENLSWFNRLFKEYYRLTPTEYRARKNFFFRSI
ncbi:AraC family transcriptional regulator [Acutalibacter sp. 1XD8-33]|uniref:AraC family transcriptional regulator n=1 Tax=Acutalibacter sp. 1XD8-33 TaxID=2320081 RepID=UPI000EA35552|nr:helix-turn-helix domain-containing protein [Acutalibacter sp. 1XD8-33]RKJ39864.1 AraC family transcriptional regulator [Acutalibacter sp. 1XD8-33]